MRLFETIKLHNWGDVCDGVASSRSDLLPQATTIFPKAAFGNQPIPPIKETIALPLALSL